MTNYADSYWNGKPIYYLTSLVSKMYRGPASMDRIYSHISSPKEKVIFLMSLPPLPPPPPIIVIYNPPDIEIPAGNA